MQRWSHLPRTYRIAQSLDSDIYHFHDPELLPVGILLQTTTDASVIYDAHEDYGYNAIEYREWIPTAIRPSIARSFPKIQSAFANRLDMVITTTESIAKQFRELGHTNVEVIHNFPKTKNITISDSPVEQSKDITLVYVGSFEHIHGLIPMLQLVDELNQRDYEVELWMLGTFADDKNEERAAQFIAQNNLSEAVQFFGRIPYEDIFPYLAEADIGLCLVDKERCEHALPTKIFEYMYSKTPVLATDAHSIRPYVTDDVGRRVSQTNPSEQADAVLNLVSDDEQLEQMGEQGRSLVMQKYNWEQEAQRLIEIYNSLI